MTSKTAIQETSLSPGNISMSQDKGHVEQPVSAALHTPNSQKEKFHDCHQNTQIENWENEGGADPDHARGVHRSSGIAQISYVSGHIAEAERLIEKGEFDAAYDQLEAAADRFVAYRDKINTSFATSIAHLTTLGCRATPPHPNALKIIRLRQKITA